ncbi:S26 family signal peptidase, partial [Georgenia sp. 10Sc9-8]|nr:S26 family signal peptidase [Georgenia halotolerans]
YTVQRVKEVLWSAPGLGRVVARLQQPVVLGVTTMAVTVLVTWVLWPRTTARTENLQPTGGHP